MNKTFAVVGSRNIIIGGNMEVKDDKLTSDMRFEAIAYKRLQNAAFGLCKRGYTLNCCGANGADQAGLDGAIDAEGKVKFFLPVTNHNKHPSRGVCPTNGYLKDIISVWALYAKKAGRPPFERMGEFVQLLMLRSAMAVDASDFIVTFAHDETLGGTAWTIFYARQKGVRVFNLVDGLDELIAYVKEVKNA